MKKSYLSKAQLKTKYELKTPKKTSIYVNNDLELSSARLFKLVNLFKIQEVFELNISANLFVDDWIMLSDSIRKCPTLKHLYLSNSSNLMYGKCRDGTTINSYDLNTTDIFQKNKLKFQKNTLESIGLSDLHTQSGMYDYFVELITSHKDSLKHINIFNSAIPLKCFSVICSIPNLETMRFVTSDIVLPTLTTQSPSIQVFFSASPIQSQIIEAFHSHPNLYMYFDENFVSKSSNLFVYDTAVTTFQSRVTDALTNACLPTDIIDIVLDYSDTLDNYTALAGDVFAE